MTTTQYEFILTSRPAEGVGLLTLNRPKALNALSTPLFNELNAALKEFDADDSIRCLVLTGSERAFAGECVFLTASRWWLKVVWGSWRGHQGDEGQDLCALFLPSIEHLIDPYSLRRLQEQLPRELAVRTHDDPQAHHRSRQRIRRTSPPHYHSPL